MREDGGVGVRAVVFLKVCDVRRAPSNAAMFGANPDSTCI